MSTQESKKTTMKNIIAIVGFVILLIVGIWSAIQVIRFVPRLFSDTGTVATITDNKINLGNRDIVVEVSKDTANSGEPVSINWAHNGDNDGVLSFSYACKEGFHFQVAGQSIACNAPFSLPITDTSLEVIPLSTKENVQAAFAITYTNTSEESIRDTKTLLVLNDSVIETNVPTGEEVVVNIAGPGPKEPEVVAAKPTTRVTARTNTIPAVQTIRVPRASDPYGVSDLNVEIVSIGDINRFGAFEPKGIVHQYARGAVTFRVTNLGTKETGNWNFTAVLPTQGGYPFNSQAQPSLMPGSSTDIFMTFNQLVPGVHTFTVHVDPQNYIPEWSDQNNIATQAITVLTY